MDQKQDFKNIWLILLSITSVIFLVVGFIMLVIDQIYINGSQFIITSLIYITAIFVIMKSKFRPNFLNPMLNLGFAFSIIGLANVPAINLYFGMWIFGIIIFLVGLFNRNIIDNT